MELVRLQTTFAISHDESRYAFRGVLFVIRERESSSRPVC